MNLYHSRLFNIIYIMRTKTFVCESYERLVHKWSYYGLYATP